MRKRTAGRPTSWIVLIFGLALTGCGGKGGDGSGAVPIANLSDADKAGFMRTNVTGKSGGTFLTTALGDPKTFNIILAKETTSTTPLGYVFDGLVARNADTLEIEPSLAESWTTSPDGLVWTFNLRKGVRWSDGQPFTADDVVFTLDVIYDTKTDASIRSVLTLNGKPFQYKKLDDATVEITLPAPFGAVLDAATFAIVPKHKLEGPYKAGQFNSTWGVNTNPQEIVGTSAFTILRYMPGEKIVFKRNPYYWKLAADGKQLPFLEGGIIQVVPDLNAAVLKFKAKESDWVNLRPDDWNTMKAEEASGSYTASDLGPAWGIEYITFNQNPRAKSVPPYKLAWFMKKEFRQAVSYAVDREAIIKTALRGLGRSLWSPVSEANKPYYNTNVQKYPKDTAKAEALLKQAGFVKKGDQLFDAQDHPVEFNLTTNSSNPIRVTYCTIVQEDLKKLGMKVNFQPIEFNALVKKFQDTFDWEAVVLGNTGGVEPMLGKALWRSDGALHHWNPRQSKPATPWEAEIDKIFDEADRTVDKEKRKRLCAKFQEIVAEQQPVVFLVTSDALLAIRNRFKNTKPTSLGGANWNIEQMYVE